MSQPDLFVVCKNCGSEVSPYVTECPYCGQRVRKRAPKLERADGEPRPKKRRRERLPRLRAGEIEGIAPETRPTFTFALIALFAVALFGSMLERRFGAFATLATFLLAGGAGAAAAVALDAPGLGDNDGLVLGANGAALGLLCAWLVDDRRAARRGVDRENDLVGVAVLAAMLALLSVAEPDANPVAAVAGAATGGLIGLTLPLFGRARR